MKKKSIRSWWEHPMMSVSGCIDSYGAITAHAAEGIETHRYDELQGKRWRWLIQRQEFVSVAPRTVEDANNRIERLHLTEEEHFAVCEWLVVHGYADDQIMPTRK